MGGALIALAVIGGLIVVVLLWMIVQYNALIRLRNFVKESWAQIDVQLKRRHDLIPNLVNTVKGYASHEAGTLEKVVEARSKAVGAQSIPDKIDAEQELSSALGRLMVVVEQYPDLKANRNFLALQEELTSTENKIGFSRQHYNERVMQMNTKVQSFPANIVAGMFNFGEEKYFELDSPAERAVPKVEF